MTAHRTTPDFAGDYVSVDESPHKPGVVVAAGGRSASGAALVAPADRVSLAQAVAGDEYVVLRRSELATVMDVFDWDSADESAQDAAQSLGADLAGCDQ